MFVPFFTVDTDLSAFSKLKVLFLVKKIRTADILLFSFWIVPVFLNFLWFILLKGKNSIGFLFLPVFKVYFSDLSSPDFSLWNSPWGFCLLAFMIFSLCLRIVYGRTLYKKMKFFQKKQKDFLWDKTSRFWLVIFVPGLSFNIYSTLFRLTNFESVHQYNL